MILFTERRGTGDLTFVLLPFLGGSHREWSAVLDHLHDDIPTLAIDLPGFGDSANIPGYTVAEMAESLLETLAAQPALKRFVLVGHSMAGKVSAVLARVAADGDPRASGLAALVLVAPSPPSPEPMTDRKRAQMLDSLGGAPAAPDDERAARRDHSAAESYIQNNAADDLPPALLAAATADILRMDRAAWRAWLEHGSREDWSARVGILPLPVLLVAGDRDGSLGPDVQKSVSLPHWPNARLATLHSNHLIPMEKPAELARLLAEFARGLNGDGVRADLAPAASAPPAEVPMDRPYIDLILSDRVSQPTRDVLSARAEPDDPAYAPLALTITQLAQLRAVAARIVPQRGPVPIDLAARIDTHLAAGQSDGWRFAELPPDAAAYAAGLDTLDWHSNAEHHTGWLALTPAQQDDLLTRAQAGRLGRSRAGSLLNRLEAMVGAGADTQPALSADQLKLWFEDVRADLTRIYMSHPATLDRIGYSGIADGANSRPGTGFTLIGIGEVESWEPEARTAPVLSSPVPDSTKG